MTLVWPGLDHGPTALPTAEMELGVHVAQLSKARALLAAFPQNLEPNTTVHWSQ